MKSEFANIGEMVATQARRYSDKIAIRYLERDITYRELDEQSTRVANGLQKLGVRKGDRVCILMDNSPEFFYAYFGIIKIGGIAGPINCWWQTGEIQYLLNDSGAVCLLVDHNYREHVDKIIDDTPALKNVIEREATDDRFHAFENMMAEEVSLPTVEIDLSDVSTIVIHRARRVLPRAFYLPTRIFDQLLAGEPARQHRRERRNHVFPPSVPRQRTGNHRNISPDERITDYPAPGFLGLRVLGVCREIPRLHL